MNPSRLASVALLSLLLVAGRGDPRFDRIMQTAREEAWYELPLGQVMQHVGEQFLGAPYEAGLLDRADEERLVLDLQRFDCVLFVETVLALSRGIVRQDYDHASFARRIEEQRYRGGSREGYCSRLHYFTEWIADNERRGIVRNVTEGPGTEHTPRSLNFMGRHRDAYPRLVSDSLYACVLEMESSLDGRDMPFIPRDRIRDAYPRLQAGDVVAIVTSVDGLDVAHTGLVFDPGDGGRGLLHASLRDGVVVSPDIQSYLENNASHTGIVVARPVDARPR